jgi:hypothetical protein
MTVSAEQKGRQGQEWSSQSSGFSSSNHSSRHAVSVEVTELERTIRKNWLSTLFIFLL